MSPDAVQVLTLPAAASHHGRGPARRPRLYDFPKEHRAKLHSTNPVERVNGEIKRRTSVVGIFPNDASSCLVGAVLLEQDNEWIVGRRYITLESSAPLSDHPTIKLSAVAAWEIRPYPPNTA